MAALCGEKERAAAAARRGDATRLSGVYFCELADTREEKLHVEEKHDAPLKELTVALGNDL